MRWTKPKYRDTKIKRKFAFLPIKVKNEVRWLEWVTVKYEYYVNRDCLIGWWATEFINEHKEV